MSSRCDLNSAGLPALQACGRTGRRDGDPDVAEAAWRAGNKGPMLSGRGDGGVRGQGGVRTEPEHGHHRRSPLLTLRATPCTRRAPCRPCWACASRGSLVPGPRGPASPPGQHAGLRVGLQGVCPPREPVPLLPGHRRPAFPPGLCGVERLWRRPCSLLSAHFLLPAGLWLYLAGSSLPCLTLIGSPNFGYRSVHRDLEAQIAIVTESRALQQQFHQVGWGCGAVGV